jgi:hypothetical protein
MNRLFLFLFAVAMSGCATHTAKRVNIVHDYVLNRATETCTDHGGLHYVVTNSSVEDDGDSYPCKNTFAFRCQDQTLHKFNDGVAYCFISESQLQETLSTFKSSKPTPSYERVNLNQ